MKYAGIIFGVCVSTFSMGQNNFPSSGNVGIGVASPSAQLQLADVYAPGGENLLIGDDGYFSDVDEANTLGLYGFQNNDRGGIKLGSSAPTLFGLNGSIGIGTTNPSPNSRLDLYGGGLNIGGDGTTADAALHIKTSYSFWDRLTQIHPSVASKPALNLMGSTDASLNFNWWAWGVLSSGSWAFQPSSIFGGSAGLFIDRNGNASIGTLDPKGYKLAVAGNVVAEAITVKTQGNWPDYVFEKEYHLPSLDSIKNYIDLNKHLPEVPSAKEMEANGVNLGEMNMVLLKKIEALTLYMINQGRELEKLKLRNDQLEAKVNALKNDE